MQPLPDAFIGLSTFEKGQLLELPWEISKIEDVESFEDKFFFVSSGRVYNNNDELLTINSEIYGALPFITSKNHSYKSQEEHLIKHLATNDLVNFFINHPAAMKSYLGMMSHKGSSILPHWQNLAKVVTVVSNESNWEPIHFSLTSADFHYHQSTETKKKSIYLEFQQDTLSIFNLIGVNEPLAITALEAKSKEKKATIDFARIIKERTLEYNTAVDLLNIQYLSPYNLSQEEWISLYWVLNEKYDLIIAHCGKSRVPYLYEESRCIFFLATNETVGFEADFFQNNLTMWPLVKRIIYKGKVNKTNLPFYPKIDMVKENDILRPVMPEDRKIEKFKIWLSQNIQNYLCNNDWVFFSNCFGDSNLIVNLLSYLSMSKDEVTRDQKPKVYIDKFLKNNIAVFEGLSSLWGLVASESVSYKQLSQIAKKIDNEFWQSQMQPVFPKEGIYSQEPVNQLIKKIFGNNRLVKGDSFSIMADVKNESIFFNNMSNVENTLNFSMFPDGMIEKHPDNKINLALPISSNKKMRHLFSGETKYWKNYLAYGFRLGLSQATFFELKPKFSNIKFFNKIILKSKSTPVKDVSGNNIKIIPIEVNSDSKNSLIISKELDFIFGIKNNEQQNETSPEIKDEK